jgi:hypothetical protein
MKKVKNCLYFDNKAKGKHRKELKRKCRKHLYIKKGLILGGVYKGQLKHKSKNPNKIRPLTEKAPSNFSFISNTEELLNFFNKLKGKFNNRNNVSLDLSDINHIDPSSISLLVANIKDDRFLRGMTVTGNTPKDENLKKVFLESGFFDYVKSSTPRTKHNNILFHKSNKRAIGEIAKDIVEKATSHIENNDIEVVSSLYEILMELMDNTNSHANPRKKSCYNWWMYMYKEPKQKKVSFAFVDLGIGIFKSFVSKGLMDKIELFVGAKHNIDFLEDFFSGNIGSRTGKPFRGKGWPLIYKYAKRISNIKNLTLISNNVYANIPLESYQKLNTPFDGTFVYWELYS